MAEKYVFTTDILLRVNTIEEALGNEFKLDNALKKEINNHRRKYNRLVRGTALTMLDGSFCVCSQANVNVIKSQMRSLHQDIVYLGENVVKAIIDDERNEHSEEDITALVKLNIATRMSTPVLTQLTPEQVISLSHTVEDERFQLMLSTNREIEKCIEAGNSIDKLRNTIALNHARYLNVVVCMLDEADARMAEQQLNDFMANFDSLELQTDDDLDGLHKAKYSLEMMVNTNIDNLPLNQAQATKTEMVNTHETGLDAFEF